MEQLLTISHSLISAFYKNKHGAYISPKFQHTFQVPTMNGDVTSTSEVPMDTKMVLLIINYTHDSGVAPNGITQKSQNG